LLVFDAPDHARYLQNEHLTRTSSKGFAVDDIGY
jgi:hypothetical protein